MVVGSVLLGLIMGQIVATFACPALFPDGVPKGWPNGLMVILVSLFHLVGILVGVWIGSRLSQNVGAQETFSRRRAIWVQVLVISVFSMIVISVTGALAVKLSISLAGSNV